MNMISSLSRTLTPALPATFSDPGAELVLLSEQTSELAIPYMGTFWSRQFSQVNFPVFNAHSAGIFSYLYHEYITG